MHVRTILGIIRLHAAREMLRISPHVPTKFLIFFLYNEIPKGGYVLEELPDSLKKVNCGQPCSTSSILKSVNLDRLILGVLAMLGTGGVCLTRVLTDPLVPSSFGAWINYAGKNHIGAISFLIADFFLFFGVFALTAVQASQISCNITTNEMANAWQYSNLIGPGGRFRNPYDHGIKKNYSDFLINGYNEDLEYVEESGNFEEGLGMMHMARGSTITNGDSHSHSDDNFVISYDTIQEYYLVDQVHKSDDNNCVISQDAITCLDTTSGAKGPLNEVRTSDLDAHKLAVAENQMSVQDINVISQNNTLDFYHVQIMDPLEVLPMEPLEVDSLNLQVFLAQYHDHCIQRGTCIESLL
jgi:hypothetical protein